MTRITLTLAAVLSAAILLPAPVLAAGKAEAGRVIAERWCAACHVVSEDQQSASADLPTFHFIAEKYDDNMDVLAAFLADPHPVMPDMSLTRQEILDLIAYFGSLR